MLVLSPGPVGSLDNMAAGTDEGQDQCVLTVILARPPPFIISDDKSDLSSP